MSEFGVRSAAQIARRNDTLRSERAHLSTVVMNIKLPRAMRTAIDQRVAKLHNAELSRLRSAVSTGRRTEYTIPSLNLSTLTRLAIELGLQQLEKMSDRDIVDQILTNGLRRGKQRGGEII